ncbi:MAG TPA: glutathione S-transferase family protein [Ramlibacter sp.]|jgi:glutathione S-transferase|nr:glutathione S-transferase family protein [Ramlibacter sp.]
MSDYTLVIGNKNYSSWSLRPWLAMRQAGLPFREVRIPLYTPESKAQIRSYSPSGKVPCLVDGALAVWDSLAICEYLAERHPQAKLWPADPHARAVARSISAEMHSGFQNLRSNMSMNCRKRFPGMGRTVEVAGEIERVQRSWGEAREKHGAGGPFLFGAFTIADAMYAPVVLRFRTYAVQLNPVCREYAEAILALPAMQQWLADAEAETEVIAAFEPQQA